MIPLKALRTAQLFQMSWPRISSTVGSLNGSISFDGEDEDSVSDIVLDLYDRVLEVERSRSGLRRTDECGKSHKAEKRESAARENIGVFCVSRGCETVEFCPRNPEELELS